jgi:hypothetical protein
MSQVLGAFGVLDFTMLRPVHQLYSDLRGLSLGLAIWSSITWFCSVSLREWRLRTCKSVNITHIPNLKFIIYHP